jgi:hypothetical protein
MTILFGIIAILAFIISSSALLIVFSKYTHLQTRIEGQEKQLNRLKADVSAMCAGAVNLGEHLAHLELRAHQLVQRQDQLEMHEPSVQSYRHASKLMRKGANFDEVMADCGLARGEVELVALAQRIKKAS